MLTNGDNLEFRRLTIRPWPTSRFSVYEFIFNKPQSDSLVSEFRAAIPETVVVNADCRLATFSVSDKLQRDQFTPLVLVEDSVMVTGFDP